MSSDRGSGRDSGGEERARAAPPPARRRPGCRVTAAAAAVALVALAAAAAARWPAEARGAATAVACHLCGHMEAPIPPARDSELVVARCAPVAPGARVFGHGLARVAASLEALLRARERWLAVTAAHLGVPACVGAVTLADARTFVFANPHIRRRSDDTVDVREEDALFKGVGAVHKERARTVLLSYLSVEHPHAPKAATFTGRDALLIQHAVDVMHGEFGTQN